MPISIPRRHRLLTATALTAAACFVATPGDTGEVVNGDAFELQGERIRLHGVDAFETRPAVP